jgi:hypothetical protein
MTQTEQVMDWQARGYFRFPFRDSPPAVDEAYLNDWHLFEHHLERSKSGHFSNPREMWLHSRKARGWQVSGAYCYLIGHTSPLAFLDELRTVAADFRDIGAAVDAARILAISGLLSEVLPILNFIREFLDIGEFQGAFWDISRLLDDGTKVFASADVLKHLEEGDLFQDYARHVKAAYSALSAKLGTDQVRVFRGAIFDIRTLIEYMRASAGGGAFDPKLRQLFEAVTGIDCSDFYVDRVAQPLRIHAFLEAFDDDGIADNFLPGRRYFFGHPVPD